MDVAGAARAQAVNRVLMGTGLVLMPSRAAWPWTGRRPRDPGTRALARALGIRDLLLGVAGLLAERDGSPAWAWRAFAAQAVADGTDAVALVLVERDVPARARLVGGTLAAGSAAVAAAHAVRLRASDVAR